MQGGVPYERHQSYFFLKTFKYLHFQEMPSIFFSILISVLRKDEYIHKLLLVQIMTFWQTSFYFSRGSSPSDRLVLPPPPSVFDPDGIK